MTTTADLLDALPVAIYTTDREGRITFFNQAAAELWGHQPALGSSQWCGSWRLYWPDGRPLPHDECPMAVALKEGRAVWGLRAIAERPDGTRVPFRAYPTPLKDASGQVIGAVNMLVDISAEKEAEIGSARLAAIVASSDDAIISKTLEGRITSWNAGATRILGYEPSEIIGQHITRLIPPELHAEEGEILAKLRRGEHIAHYETVRVARDGRRVDMSITVSPLRNDLGEVIGASKVGRDVTERKQAEKLQNLLTEELRHRIKNTLATVQAIATQSLRHAKSQSDFVDGFTGRVQALAKAHSLLTQTRMQGAELTQLIQEQVLLGVSGDSRISYSGPLLVLEPQLAVHLALVLHELATNARKYGALSVRTGRLSIDWSTRTNIDRTLHLRWKESGGPQVSATNVRGFGTSLIEQTLRGHGGEASVQYAADGVTCEIELPLPNDVSLDIRADMAGSEMGSGSFLRPQDNPANILKAKRILIVEDEPLVAMDMESTLLAAGCKVIGPAGTIEQAMQLIANTECDAALLDGNLGGRSVEELAGALTQKNIPFAFVTGYGRKGLPAGFQEAVMLTKPFGGEQLLAMVEVVLYLRQPGSDIVQLRQKRF